MTDPPRRAKLPKQPPKSSPPSFEPLSTSPVPPQIHVDLLDQPILAESYQARLHDPDAGAIGWFHGVTRRTTGEQVTETLHYEAHTTMARTQLDQLARNAAERFGLRGVVIVHRLGEVPIGQASVLVGCLGGHRKEVFEALPWIMDELKQDVPIWKRETLIDGKQLWIH